MNDRTGRMAVYELETAARLTRLPPARVRRYVRVGLDPAGPGRGPEPRSSSDAELARLRTIRRLGEDLGLNSRRRRGRASAGRRDRGASQSARRATRPRKTRRAHGDQHEQAHREGAGGDRPPRSGWPRSAAHPARAGAPALRAGRPGGRRRAGGPGEARRPAERVVLRRLEPAFGAFARASGADSRSTSRIDSRACSTRRAGRGRAAQGRLRLDRALPARPGRRPGTGRGRPAPAPARRHPRPGLPGAPGGPRRPARDSREPGGDLPGAGAVRPRPDRARPPGQARPGDRPRRGDPARHPGAQPADQEQPGADRRAGRRQDGHRRGAGPAHRARRRARRA